MDKNVWLGALLTAGIGFLAWVGIQMFNSYKDLRLENKRLKDEEEKAIKKNMDALSKELQMNTLAVARLDVKLANVEKFGGMLYSLSKDMEELKKWKDTEEEDNEASDS